MSYNILNWRKDEKQIKQLIRDGRYKEVKKELVRINKITDKPYYINTFVEGALYIINLIVPNEYS